MRPRRGFALLAAIWLVVAIAAVALQFSLDARERRLLGINTAERGRGRAAASGALNSLQAELEEALRQTPGSSVGGRMLGARASDPWLDVDSLYSGFLGIDSIPVQIAIRDLGTQLNINNMNENQLRTFFNFALRDFSAAERLTQGILDWRDPDSLPRPQGIERDGYLRESRLVLPSNQPFREVSELLDVYGMTPEIFERVAPYLTTRGTGIINVNTADTLVLRSVPGMTDEVLAQILSQRGQGRRIASLNSVMPRAGRGRGGRPGANGLALTRGLTVDVAELQLTLTAYVGPQELPVRLNAILQRQGTGSRITWRQW